MIINDDQLWSMMINDDQWYSMIVNDQWWWWWARWGWKWQWWWWWWGMVIMTMMMVNWWKNASHLYGAPLLTSLRLRRRKKLSSDPKFKNKHATHKLVLKEFHLDLYIGHPTQPPAHMAATIWPAGVGRRCPLTHETKLNTEVLNILNCCPLTHETELNTEQLNCSIYSTTQLSSIHWANQYTQLIIVLTDTQLNTINSSICSREWALHSL